MISIKSSMDRLEGVEGRLGALASVCVRILQALERSALVLVGESSQGFRDRLAAAASQLTPQSTADLIEQGGTSIEQELDQFTRDLAITIGNKESQYKEVVRLVGEAATTLAQTGLGNGQELIDFASKIEAVSRLDDVSDIRQQLTHRVAEIKTIAERVHREGEARAAELERKVQSVTEKLKRVETLAETDALTGLGNRRHADHSLHAAIASGQPFCLFVFDLNGFKAINDRLGHSQGDQLLKAVARDLKAAVRSGDVVCRWGGDEFIIIMANTTLADAQERLPRIQASAFGTYVLTDHGKDVRVNITASVGIAEYRPGESVTDFFERADQHLYHQKQQRRA